MAAEKPWGTPEDGFCSAREDQAHCNHWWDCEPCCSCGFDGGGEGCDCPRHNPDDHRTMEAHRG